MRYEKNRKIFGLDEYKVMKTMKFLALPLIAVILIIVILVVNRVAELRQAADEESRRAESVRQELETEASSVKETEPQETIPDYSGITPVGNVDPAIDELIEAYQNARVKGDAVEMYRIFGREGTEGLDALRERMQEEKKIYVKFWETQNYVLPAVRGDQRIIYTRSEIQFKRTSNRAPVFYRSFVELGEDGKWYIKEDARLSDLEREAVRAADACPAVQAMDAEVRQALSRVVIDDPFLGSIYQQLSGDVPETEAAPVPQEGSGPVIVIEDTEGADAEESAPQETAEIILIESTAAPETAEAAVTESGAEGAAAPEAAETVESLETGVSGEETAESAPAEGESAPAAGESVPEAEESASAASGDASAASEESAEEGGASEAAGEGGSEAADESEPAEEDGASEAAGESGSDAESAEEAAESGS